MMRSTPQLPLTALAVPLLIVAVSAFLRLHQLATIPFGWHLDEASKGIIAREVLQGGPTPVFFSQFTGREGLFIYLEAGAFALFGETVFSGRVLNAFTGILTVALTIPLGAALWPGATGRQVGRWAALFLAVSLWHLIASRNGYRGVLQPLVQLPALILWLRAVRHPNPRAHWRLWVGAGFFAGLTLYTYTAARVFPILLFALGVWAVAWGPHRRAKALGLGLLCLTMLITATPLLVRFYYNPADFYGRAEQISLFNPANTGNNFWGRLQHNLRETVGMFTARGDSNFRFNIGLRPVFEGGTGALFWLGVAMSGLDLWRRRWRWAAGVLWLWLLLMLLPMTLSTEGLPYYQRALGILPGAMLLPALGVVGVWGWAQKYARLPAGLMEGALVLLAVGLGAAAWQEYVVNWHSVPQNDADRRVAMVYVADEFSAHPPSHTFYIATEYPNHTTLAFLSPQWYEAAQWVDARQALALPPEGEAYAYYVLLETPPSMELLQRAGLAQARVVSDRFGQPVLAIYETVSRWPTPAYTELGWSWENSFFAGWKPNPLVTPTTLQNLLRVRGYDMPAEPVAAGATVNLMMQWELLGTADREYTMFAHLLDEQGQIVAQFDANRHPATGWQAGELLLSEFPLQLPPALAPGSYHLAVGLYEPWSGERLLVVDGAGEVVADRLFLRDVIVK